MSDQPKIRLPKISQSARGRVEETIEFNRQIGDRQLATDIEVLLEWHDKFHGIEAQ